MWAYVTVCLLTTELDRGQAQSRCSINTCRTHQFACSLPHPNAPPASCTLALELKKALVKSWMGRWELMRRGLGWSERLKAPMMVSHQGARFQMGTEWIQDGSPSFRIKLRISIIQLVPVGRYWANHIRRDQDFQSRNSRLKETKAAKVAKLGRDACGGDWLTVYPTPFHLPTRNTTGPLFPRLPCRCMQGPRDQVLAK